MQVSCIFSLCQTGKWFQDIQMVEHNPKKMELILLVAKVLFWYTDRSWCKLEFQDHPNNEPWSWKFDHELATFFGRWLPPANAVACLLSHSCLAWYLVSLSSSMCFASFCDVGFLCPISMQSTTNSCTNNDNCCDQCTATECKTVISVEVHQIMLDSFLGSQWMYWPDCREDLVETNNGRCARMLQ